MSEITNEQRLTVTMVDEDLNRSTFTIVGTIIDDKINERISAENFTRILADARATIVHPLIED